jgi:hypothetical protein
MGQCCRFQKYAVTPSQAQHYKHKAHKHQRALTKFHIREQLEDKLWEELEFYEELVAREQQEAEDERLIRKLYDDEYQDMLLLEEEEREKKNDIGFQDMMYAEMCEEAESFMEEDTWPEWY